MTCRKYVDTPVFFEVHTGSIINISQIVSVQSVNSIPMLSGAEEIATIITMSDGSTYKVPESPEEIIRILCGEVSDIPD